MISARLVLQLREGGALLVLEIEAVLVLRRSVFWADMAIALRFNP